MVDVLCRPVVDRTRGLGGSRRAVVVGDDDELGAGSWDAPTAARASCRDRRATAADAAADVAGEVYPLMDAVVWGEATVVVLGTDAQFDERIVDQVAALHEFGVRVRTRSLFYEEWLGKIPVQRPGRVALFFDIGELHRDRYGRTKRIFDVVFGVIGVIVMVVAIPFVFVGNLIGNRGRIFFVQERVGRSGTTFSILKFRTMREDSDLPTDWTSSVDPRVTRFGRILRISHLDELPQMVNIVRGDLSLVGPRRNSLATSRSCGRSRRSTTCATSCGPA